MTDAPMTTGERVVPAVRELCGGRRPHRRAGRAQGVLSDARAHAAASAGAASDGSPAHLAGRYHPLLRHGLGARRAAVAVALAAAHHDHVLHFSHSRQCVAKLELEIVTCVPVIHALW